MNFLFLSLLPAEKPHQCTKNGTSLVVVPVLFNAKSISVTLDPPDYESLHQFLCTCVIIF